MSTLVKSLAWFLCLLGFGLLTEQTKMATLPRANAPLDLTNFLLYII